MPKDLRFPPSPCTVIGGVRVGDEAMVSSYNNMYDAFGGEDEIVRV